VEFSVLQGDVNKDCIVNIIDLATAGLCFRRPAIGNCENADVNKDGEINIFDLAAIGINFGEKCL
jgi:hypothetical protein